MSDKLIPSEALVSKIFVIRGHKVMLDSDLADVYGVSVKRLNEQVKRNAGRFPEDFCFRLTSVEWVTLGVFRSRFATLNLKSQIATSSWGGRRKLPYAFTEHGAIQAANVLNSELAVVMGVAVVRAFVRLREMAFGYKDLREKIEKMEAKYDGQFGLVFKTLKKMLEPPRRHSKKIGFVKGG